MTQPPPIKQQWTINRYYPCGYYLSHPRHGDVNAVFFHGADAQRVKVFLHENEPGLVFEYLASQCIPYQQVKPKPYRFNGVRLVKRSLGGVSR